jgi:hypothetical protein
VAATKEKENLHNQATKAVKKFKNRKDIHDKADFAPLMLRELVYPVGYVGLGHEGHRGWKPKGLFGPGAAR